MVSMSGAEDTIPILTAQGRMSVKTASICWARNAGLTS